MNYCQCKCGQIVKNKWATGHHRKGKTFHLSDEAKRKLSKSMIGNTNGRFCRGYTHTEGQKIKIRKARAKQIITTEHRVAISNGLRNAYLNGRRTDIGEKKWNWKGGIKSEVFKIRKSFEMTLWRRSVFMRDNFTCRECKIIGGELHAHHIKSFSEYPELRFAIDNGITLCKECHKKTDTYLGKSRIKVKNMVKYINIWQ